MQQHPCVDCVCWTALAGWLGLEWAWAGDFLGHAGAGLPRQDGWSGCGLGSLLF